ncbi:aminotransferase class I/II-fold pyridoxal phosphate-dependent enzyme [Micrococcus lylae]|uniref:aminotransferase class I/II-fold pyridoxal phosphate-dependent enzyme n=1 Tax=Micrococcus lylae TaxID=1273 RepID=UPI0035CCEEE8
MQSDRRPLGPSTRAQVPPFMVMDILGRVAELRAEGRDVVSLCAGEPGAGAPPTVNEAAAAVHASGRALTYTPASGIRPLCEAIAGHYARWYGLDVAPEQVAVTTGSSGAFLLGFLCAFEAGDRVALARPGYPAYRNILTSLGCEVVELDAGPDVRHQPTVELLEAAEAEGGPLAGLILASPANPTGTMVTAAELEALAVWCEEHQVRLVSDEIYHGIVYRGGGGAEEAELSGAADGAAGGEAAGGAAGEPGEAAGEPTADRGACAWTFTRTALVISSFSKYWGMPGWRLGWMLVPEDLRAAVDGLAGSAALCPPAAAQEAAVAAFGEEAYAFCEEQVRGFAATRGVLLERVPELGWADVAPADGAFYLWARLPQWALQRYGNALGYCTALLEEAGVAITPGDDFDAVHGPESVRLSFAAGKEAVAEALERIVAWQERVRPGPGPGVRP